jgi:hypothetical protein
VLGVSQEKVFIYFAVAAVTGPVLGTIVGGYVFNRIGGYNNP